MRRQETARAVIGAQLLRQTTIQPLVGLVIHDLQHRGVVADLVEQRVDVKIGLRPVGGQGDQYAWNLTGTTHHEADGH